MKTLIPIILILFGLINPLCSQEVIHLSCAADEDNNPIYDSNYEDPKTVEWNGGKKHNVGYYNFRGYTLIIKGVELTGNFVLDGVDTTSTLIIEDCVFGIDGSDYEFQNISGSWDCKSSVSNSTFNNFPGCSNFGHCDITDCKFYFNRGAKLILSDYQNIKNLHTAVPLIMNNEFHGQGQYDLLDIRGANAEIIGNRFFYSEMTGRADQSIQMGYLSDLASPTQGWYPRSGKTIVKDNESMGSFEILTKHAYQPMYDAIKQFSLEIEITNNIFKPTYGGAGGGPAEVPVYCNVSIQNNTFKGRGIIIYSDYLQEDNTKYMEPHESLMINNNVFEPGIGGWGGGTAVSYGYPTENWVNAENNNWGHVSGPNNDSNRDGDTNNGKGMGVGDFIDYRPFIGIAAETEIDLNLQVGIINPDDEPPFVEYQEVGFSPEIEYNLKSGKGNIHLDVYTNYGDPVVSNLPFIIAESGEHTTKFEDLIIEIPEGIDKLIFQASLHPKSGTYSYSNEVEFNVHHPGAKLQTSFTGIDPEEDNVLINGKDHIVHLNVKYKSQKEGSLKFIATERNAETPQINLTELFVHEQSFDPSTGNLWKEISDVPITLTVPLRGVDGPPSEILIETILETDEFRITDEIILKVHEVKDEISLGLKLKRDLENVTDWKPLDYLRTGEHYLLGFRVDTDISSENSTLWKIRTKLTTTDEYGIVIDDKYAHEEGSTEIYYWEINEEVNISFRSENPIAENTVKGELTIELVNENGIVIKHIEEPIAIRSASQKVELPAPEGDISLDFAPVSLKLNIDGNAQENDVTAYEYDHSHEIGIPESFKTAYSVSSFLNRFWETMTNITEFDQAQVEITINPDTDWPEDFEYDGDSLAIAVWDTVQKEYIFLPTEFDDFVLTADIDNLSTSYLVAIFAETSSIHDIVISPSGEVIELLGNFPNPVDYNTRIRFNLKEPTTVECTIYNITGKKIWSSARKWFSSGSQGIVFNRNNLPAGVYIYHLKADGPGHTGRMILK